MKNKITSLYLNTRTRMIMGVTALVSTVLIEPLKALANDYDFLTDGAGDVDPFATLNETTQSVGASGFTFLRTIGIICLMLAIVMIGISFAISKNAQTREQNKQHALYVVIGAACIFGVMGLIGILADFGTAFGE